MNEEGGGKQGGATTRPSYPATQPAPSYATWSDGSPMLPQLGDRPAAPSPSPAPAGGIDPRFMLPYPVGQIADAPGAPGPSPGHQGPRPTTAPAAPLQGVAPPGGFDTRLASPDQPAIPYGPQGGRAGPSAQPSPAGAGGLPRVRSKEEARSLPRGTHFIGPDGLVRVAP